MSPARRAAVLAALTLCAVPTAAQGAPLFGSRTLAIGMRGADVRTLQRLLSEVGCHVPADGTFTHATRRCLSSWESQLAMPVDAVATPSTQLMLADDAGQRVEGFTAGAALPTPGVPVVHLPRRRISVSPAPDIPVRHPAPTIAPAPTVAPSSSPSGATIAPSVSTPDANATLTANGLALIPLGAPPQVQEMIAAGNEIATLPYLWGGGHMSWLSPAGYDCSGSVSYVLHAAGLLDAPLVAAEFANWGEPGPGRWVTIYANSVHTWMVIAGLHFDTVGLLGSPPDRWQTQRVSVGDFAIRHPAGL